MKMLGRLARSKKSGACRSKGRIDVPTRPSHWQRGEQDMKNQNYSISLQSTNLLNKSSTHQQRSWMVVREIEGEADKLGAEFTYRYQNMHRSKQKITDLVPNKKVVWHVLDSSLSFLKDKSQWTGTTLSLMSSQKTAKRSPFYPCRSCPQIECYGSCSNAWSMLVNGNLRKLSTTGKTQPDVFA